MDAQSFTRGDAQVAAVSKLRAHCEAIRRNKDVLAIIFQYLGEEIPNASAAQEAFEELDAQDQISLWAVSPTAGGIWESWERDALKYGRLDATRTYETHCKRKGIPYYAGMKP
jgi:hypothetical protein